MKKLFPKWKTVNKIAHPDITATVGTAFTKSIDTPAIILVQEKDKVFSEGVLYRCLIKTAILTDTMDADIVMSVCGVDTYEELKAYKV